MPITDADVDAFCEALRIFHNPPPMTISGMTGIGLSNGQRNKASSRHDLDHVDVYLVVN